MMARAGSGWQTVLADLSMILFMVTAAAASEAPAEPAPAALPAARASLPALAQPVAVWTAGPDAPTLSQWLARTAGDPRLQLTILAPQQASAQALALAAGAGRPARIVLEPGEGAVQALLGYDAAGLAQGLQKGSGQNP